MHWQDTLTEVIETECYKRTILYQISAVLNLLDPSAPDSCVASLGNSGGEARLPNLPSARSPTSWPPATPPPAVVASAPPPSLLFPPSLLPSLSFFPSSFSSDVRRPVAWPSSLPSADRLPSRTGGKGCMGDSQIWPCRSRFGGFRASWGKRPLRRRLMVVAARGRAGSGRL